MRTLKQTSVMVTSSEIIDYTFNATNITTFEAGNNYKMEISKLSLNAAIINCRQAHVKILASQSNTNPDKKQTQNILTIYPH